MALTIDPTEIDGMVFDLDGVITDTARVHLAAWTKLFDSFLADRSRHTGELFEPFRAEDYRRHVDGKPRYDGVRDFLASRGVELPEGDSTDSPDAETVCGLGNRKDDYFTARLTQDGVDVFDGSVALLRALREAGLRAALFSASRNARPVLQTAGVRDLFEAVVDGIDAERLGMPGKPDPAVPLEAARLIGARPSRTVFVEDAIAGVEAGKRGGFGLVIGVDRGGAAAELQSHGADAVVSDLAEIVLVQGASS